LWGTDSTGSYVIAAGAEAYSGSNVTPTIGGESSTGAVLALATGTTLTMTKGGYVLDGNATLQDSFGIVYGMALHITEGSVLTFSPTQNNMVVNGTFIIGGPLTLDGSIVAAGNPSRIAVLTGTNYSPSITIGTRGTNNFYAQGTNEKQEVADIVPSSGTNYYYNWDAAAGGSGVAGWKLTTIVP
jgi:hypothetical protein